MPNHKGNPNNYNLQTRDLTKAGHFCVKDQARSGYIAYSSARTYSERWDQFAFYAKSQGIKKLEHITPDVVKGYAQELASKIEKNQIQASTAQHYIGVINRVMHQATTGDWRSVRAVTDCGLPSRSRVRTQPPDGMDKDKVKQAVNDIDKNLGSRAAQIPQLQRELGLRAKEASLIDAHIAAKEANEKGKVLITEGTKNGRDRTVPITKQSQLDTLISAANVQGPAKSMMDPDKSWKEWREQDLRAINNELKKHEIDRLHELRAAYSCDRYYDLTSQNAPVITGDIANQDKEARQIITEEMGHSSIDTTSSYLGGRS